MAEARKCPTCSSEIPADAPGALCPKCLLALGKREPLPPVGPPGTGEYLLERPGDVMDYYASGDVAPEGRFNYRASLSPPGRPRR